MYQRLGHPPWGFQEDDLGLNLHSAGYEPVISAPFPPLTAGTRQQPGSAGMIPFTKMTCKMSSSVAGTWAGLQACGLRFICGAQRGQRLPGHKASGSPASPGLQALTQVAERPFQHSALSPVFQGRLLKTVAFVFATDGLGQPLVPFPRSVISKPLLLTLDKGVLCSWNWCVDEKLLLLEQGLGAGERQDFRGVERMDSGLTICLTAELCYLLT